MKLLLGSLAAVLVLLQFRLWVSGEGLREVWQLREAVAAQQSENAVLAERNGQLRAEVADLKQGLTALEERARHDLGMVSANETFFQVVGQAPSAAPPRASPDEERDDSIAIRAAATP